MKVFTKISEDKRQCKRFISGLWERRKIRKFSREWENNIRNVIQGIMCSTVSIDHAQATAKMDLSCTYSNKLKFLLREMWHSVVE